MRAKRNEKEGSESFSIFFQFIESVKTLQKDVTYLLISTSFNIIFSLTIAIFIALLKL